MQQPGCPHDEGQRLKALSDLCVLDSPAEARYDRLTRIAQQHFEVPIALISLIDEHRQWIKSKQGLQICEIPRELSLCAHTILSDDVDRKSTRLNSSHSQQSRMPSSA